MSLHLPDDAPQARRHISVEFYFDLICPWCLIGKRQLDLAIDLLTLGYPDVDVVVHWKSLPLLPDIPLGGVPFHAFYLQRLGSAHAVAARRQQIADAGRAVGVAFDVARIEWMPNTIAAHRLIEYAGQFGGTALQAPLIDRLFDAYFCRGENIGELQVLADIGEAFDLERAVTLSRMATPVHESSMPSWRHDAGRRGITGVPGFVLGDRVPLLGAHQPVQLASAMLGAFSV
jgi:predicted DsbA family dithiol-disulfide isomerase